MRANRTRRGAAIGAALLLIGIGGSAAMVPERPAEAASGDVCVINLHSSAPSLTCPGGVVMSLDVVTDSEGRLVITAVKDGTFGAGIYTLRVFDPDPGQRCTDVNVVRGKRIIGDQESTSRIEFPPLSPPIECVPGQKVRKGYCVTKADGGNPAHFCSEAAVISAEYL